MCKIEDIENFFFLGIGGIGMSALARYFAAEGKRVYGYDRTPSPLTKELEEEGMHVIYGDDELEIGETGAVLCPKSTVVVRTPAVPENNRIYRWFREEGYEIYKRAEVLGMVTRAKKALCVAGTHGKTTTSTMLTHLLDGTNAFLGGISMNYETNVLIHPESNFVVVEADEYDRSFHQLRPYISIVTAVDADHLDIYGTAEAYREAFAHYTSLITGALVMKHGIELQPRLQPGVECYTYGVQETDSEAQLELPDFYACHIRIGEGTIAFDFHTPDEVITDIQLGVPVWVNIENAVAAMTVAYLVESEKPKDERALMLKDRMRSFKGVLRRFNIHVNTPKIVYIDDYAHHPEEIATAINSIRKLYPERKLIGVFQPHLYTRTRDFAKDFTRVLGTLDECILLPIYPARELPIPGVTSAILGGQLVEKSELAEVLKEKAHNATEPLVFLTVGAGDIDRLVPQVAKALQDESRKDI